MSALPPKADIRIAADLFDHLVGGHFQRQRHGQPERLRRLQVDHELEGGRLHDRQVGRLGALENLASVETDLTIGSGNAGSVADQTAGQGEFAPCRHDGKRMAGCQREDLIASTGEKDIAVDEERLGPLASKGRERRLEIAFSDCTRDENVHPDLARRVLYGCRVAAFALFGLISTAMTLAAGTSSCKSPSCFAGSGPAIRLNPVRLPPGRLRLGIRLPWTGSMPVMNTMGIVVVAALAASAEGPSPATRTVTCRRTSSAAIAGRRSY